MVPFLAILLYVLKQPNKFVHGVALGYFLLILAMIQSSSTSLVFIHLVMFTAVFSPHFSLPKILACVVAAMLVYGLTHYARWENGIPWITFTIWFFFCLMNWFSQSPDCRKFKYTLPIQPKLQRVKSHPTHDGGDACSARATKDITRAP